MEETNMLETRKKVVSFVVGIVTTFFQMYGTIFGLVGVAIVLDIITGIAASKASGTKVTSKKANQGFWRKMGLLLALSFGVFLDIFIPMSLQFISVTLPFNMPFGLIFGCYIIFNESISICENLDKINPDILPKWVKKLLIGGANKIEEVIPIEGKDDVNEQQ
jgi:toxin secretion/phage lysis holin